MVKNMLIYIGIFICKIIEDALATLRLIVVANGKKKSGAILQAIASIVWVIVTGTVIIDLNKDPLKIVFFAGGALIGSYTGSILEEKIALGNNVLMVEINQNLSNIITTELKKRKFNISNIASDKKNKEILMITSKRKKTNDAINIIKSFDNKAFIVSEDANVPHK